MRLRAVHRSAAESPWPQAMKSCSPVPPTAALCSRHSRKHCNPVALRRLHQHSESHIAAGNAALLPCASRSSAHHSRNSFKHYCCSPTLLTAARRSRRSRRQCSPATLYLPQQRIVIAMAAGNATLQPSIACSNRSVVAIALSNMALKSPQTSADGSAGETARVHLAPCACAAGRRRSRSLLRSLNPTTLPTQAQTAFSPRDANPMEPH